MGGGGGECENWGADWEEEGIYKMQTTRLSKVLVGRCRRRGWVRT